MPLKINWDDQAKTWVDNHTYLTIRTGRSRVYSNIMASLGVREPARAARIQKDITALLIAISEQGGDALNMPNIPEFETFKFDCYEVVIAHGIIFTGRTAQRLVGDYKFVTVMIDEMSDVLTEIFYLEKYIQAALSQ
jgi:hypothetical protein